MATVPFTSLALVWVVSGWALAAVALVILGLLLLRRRKTRRYASALKNRCDDMMRENDALQARSVVLEKLGHLSEAFVETADLKALLETTLDCVRELTGAPIALLQVREDDVQGLYLQVEQADGRRVELPESLVREVLAEGAHRLVPRLEVEPRYFALVEEGYHSMMVVPIPGKRNEDNPLNLGLACVLSAEDTAFTSEHLELMKTFCSHAGAIIEGARLYENSSELAIRDNLTNLYNHQHFVSQVVAEASRSGRTMTPFSIAILDVDNFASVNERFGHEMGNLVLQKLAEELTAGIRAIDVVARYGGEQFAFLLPETDGAGGKKMAGNLMQKMNDLAFRTPEGEQFKLTGTLGVSSFFLDGQTVEEVLSEAERAVALGKSKGKHCVVCAFETEQSSTDG